MKALLLTFDKQIGFAELAVKKYRQLWPDCPLHFLLPRNRPDPPSQYLANCERVKFLESPPGIRGTMEALLAGCDDDEWVFWCTDDRYPVAIPSSQRLDEITAFLASANHETLNGVKLCRWLEVLTSRKMTISDSSFRFQSTENFFGFWHPHFVRAKLLKAVFLTAALPGKYSIRELNDHFVTSGALDFLRGVLVPREDLVTYAEPCNLGHVTRNGTEDLIALDCARPDYPAGNRSIVFDARHRRRLAIRRFFGMLR